MKYIDKNKYIFIIHFKHNSFDLPTVNMKIKLSKKKFLTKFSNPNKIPWEFPDFSRHKKSLKILNFIFSSSIL